MKQHQHPTCRARPSFGRLVPTFEGKKHRLLVIEERTDFACSYFSCEKYELIKVMLGLTKDLKAHNDLVSNMPDVTMLEKMRNLSRYENRKGSLFSVSTLLWVVHIKVATLNENLLPNHASNKQCDQLF